MAKQRSSQLKRGTLLKYALEDVKRESFETIKMELKKTLKTRSGIYALYKKGEVVKVGLSIGLYGRVKGHSKNEDLNWDTASFFVVRHIRYLRDLETAVNRIAQPKYSKQLGRVADERYLERLLKRRVREKQKELRQKERKRTEQVETLQKEIKKIKEAIGN